jgi:hypothetical protein
MSLKISELTEDTSPSSDDLIVTVNDPSGTPSNKKVTISNLFAHAAQITAPGITITGLTASLPVFTGTSKEMVSKSVADTRTALGLGTADSPAFAGLTVNGNIATTGTVDGRDISADINQAVKTTDSPTFVGTTLSGLTASLPVFTDASKALISKSVADTRTALGLGTTDSPVFVTAKLSNLNDGYVPKHTSDAVGLENSPICTDVTKVGIGTTPTVTLDVQGVISPREATKTYYGGIVSEASSQIINFGMNEDSTSRFGGTYTSSVQGGLLRVDTRADNPLFGFHGRVAGSTGLMSLLVSILSNGNIGIGTTTPSYLLTVIGSASNQFVTSIRNDDTSASPGAGIDLACGNASSGLLMSFRRATDSIQIGSITHNGSNTAYNTSSDKRLKENIIPTRYSLNDLLRLSVVDFNFINDSQKRTFTGLIAQDVYEIFPDAVTKPLNESSPWGLDYGRLTPLIISAVKELTNRVEALERSYEGKAKSQN